MSDHSVEERLARIEERLSGGITGIHARLDRMNGNITENTTWRLEHEAEHREVAARRQGANDALARVSKRDAVLLGGAATVLLALLTTAANLAGRMLFG